MKVYDELVARGLIAQVTDEEKAAAVKWAEDIIAAMK